MTLVNCTATVDQRLEALHKWLPTILHEKSFSVAPLAGDASFRRYFRVKTHTQSYVVMDAPPAIENCEPFIAIATAFSQSSVRFPIIISHDVDQGFLLLSDFGDQQLLLSLDENSADKLYTSAMNTLLDLQSWNNWDVQLVPMFNDALYWKEFDIYFTWYLQTHLKRTLSFSEEIAIKKVYQQLIDSAHAQPCVFVHRDYHSRNIMLCDDGKMGILDFQDAVRGPITYDLVSLLRDCYISWPVDQTERWVDYFYKKVSEKKLANVDFPTFLRWFDWMGLQRHLKCLGIFSRLCYRDQKNNYLKEIPRVLNYAMSVCEKYPELSELKRYVV